MTSKNGQGVRWWPAALIVAGAAVAIAILAIIPEQSQQAFNLQVAKIVVIGGVLLALWLIFWSRLARQVRWTIFGLTLGVVGLMVALFRIHGVSGNLVPILEPRWTHRELPNAPSIAATPPVGTVAASADFPQFLGPHRNGHLDGPLLMTNWNSRQPPELWRHDVGLGWSGFATSGNIAVTQEQRGDAECVTAYELTSGKLVWLHSDTNRYVNTLAGEGPRATPTIAGTRVFAHGANGMLTCLNLADGKLLWSIPNEREVPTWGEATSPLVEDGLVLAHVDDALVAFRETNGAPAWSCGAAGGGYSSPASLTIEGVKQILIFAGSLIACDAKTGNALWQFPWPGGHPHVAAPVAAGTNDVILSSGYGTGSARISVHRGSDGQWKATRVWRTNRMKAKFTDLILHRGFLYGLDDGIMECIDGATGDLKWKDGRYGHGQILLVGDLLLVMAENGDVILLDPQPGELRELCRFTALHEKTWNPPALAGEYLVVRNDKEAACFRLPVR